MKRQVIVERVTTYVYELEGTAREVEDEAIELSENSAIFGGSTQHEDKSIGEGTVISNTEIEDDHQDDMDKLLRRLLLDAVSNTGTYEPEECLPLVEEAMTAPQYETAHAFLAWCHAHGHKFGHRNIDQIYAQFKERFPLPHSK